MPSVQRGKKAYHSNYYLYNAEKIKATARSWGRDDYNSNPEKKKALGKHCYSLKPDRKRAAVKKLYYADPNKKRGAVQRLYYADPDKKRGAVQRLYYADPSKKRGAVKRLYNADPDKKRGAVKQLYYAEPDKKRGAVKRLYYAEPSKKRGAVQRLYYADPDKKRGAVKQLYYADPDKKRGAVKQLYYADPDKKRGAVKQLYYADPDKKRGAVKRLYYTDPDKKKGAVRKLYYANPDKKKMKSRVYYTQNHKARLESFRKYHCCYRKKLCHLRKARYNLAKPKPVKAEMYVRKIQGHLLVDFEAKCKLKEIFHMHVLQHKCADLEKTVCKLAARKLVNISLQQRSNSAGTLLASIRSIKSLTLRGNGDFGEDCHSASTEPYFYEAAYQPVQRDTPIPVNEYGQCILAEKINSKKWKCCSECKPISKGEVNAILCLKAAFDLSVEELRVALTTCDYGCPFGHYSKQVHLL